MTIIYLSPSVDLGFDPRYSFYGSMTFVGSSTYYGAVDDPVNAPDDDISYLELLTGNLSHYKFGCYLPIDFSAKSIEYVRFWLRGARSTNGDVKIYYPFYTSNGVIISLSSIYPNYQTGASAIFYNNPITGQPWIEADFNPLVFSIRLSISNEDKIPSRATQAYVEVSYDPLELNGNGAFLLASLNQ